MKYSHFAYRHVWTTKSSISYRIETAPRAMSVETVTATVQLCEQIAQLSLTSRASRFITINGKILKTVT